MPRLTRKTISEAIQQAPIESILLGASSKGERALTSKQAKFAEAIAMGETKAGAYRKAYNTKAKPVTQSRRGQELARNGAVAAQIDALRLANEARKYATPAALRALVIERLTAHAIDADVKPAQRLRALELLGKVTEIAAFTERREIIKSTGSNDAKAQLLGILRQAISTQAIDVDAREVDRLEVAPAAGRDIQPPEIGGKTHDAQGVPASEPAERANATGTPQNSSEASASPLLSNPHLRSPLFSAATQKTSCDDFLGTDLENEEKTVDKCHWQPLPVTMLNEINNLEENFVPIDKNEGVPPSEENSGSVDNFVENTPLSDGKA